MDVLLNLISVTFFDFTDANLRSLTLENRI